MQIKSVEIERRGAVGWILINNKEEITRASLENPEAIDHSARWDHALEELGRDRSIRVIVVTGKEDGEFYRIPRTAFYESDLRNRSRLNPLQGHGEPTEGSTPRAVQILAHIDKPVIARLNGDAIGAGQAILWGCDMIVAREDALIADMHCGIGEVIDSAGDARGYHWAVTAGEGVLAFLPLYMPPTKLKEYLFLCRTWTAKQMCEMNMINYAVPIEQLDEVLDEIVGRLLLRPASVLVHTKRVLNKRMIEEWNLTQDLSVAYQKLDFWEHGAAGHLD